MEFIIQEKKDFLIRKIIFITRESDLAKEIKGEKESKTYEILKPTFLFST